MGAVNSISPDYQTAAELAEQGKLEQAWKLTGKKLLENPNDVRALVTGGYIMRRLGALAQSYHFLQSAIRLWPQDSAALTNLGHTCSEMWLIKESEAAYLKALRVPNLSDKHRTIILLNLSALYLDNGRFADAEKIILQILAKDPDHKSAQANLGFCQLARRNWEGWKGYRHTIGSDWRPKVQYGDEPEWDGSPGKVVALYGDQGLGDEISFASMIPDVAKRCSKVILDCDKRLEGLFRRSFPQVKVYGTRRTKEGEGRWAPEDRSIEASLPLGQVGEYVRTQDSDFSGLPYLVPDEDRVRMWKALFASKGKPCVGIAWTGGIPKTNARNRKLHLQDLLPVLELPCHFVSLQYQDAAEEIRAFTAAHPVDLVQYPYGTLTPDYDDTAALIASLDYVICIQTAVAHAAGALGVPVTVLIPEATQWRYGNSHDSTPWYGSLKIIKQAKNGHWESEILRARDTLAHLGQLPATAGEPARDRDVRGRLYCVCPTSQPDHRADGSEPPAGLRLREPVQPREASEGQTQA